MTVSGIRTKILFESNVLIIVSEERKTRSLAVPECLRRLADVSIEREAVFRLQITGGSKHERLSS